MGHAPGQGAAVALAARLAVLLRDVERTEVSRRPPLGRRTLREPALYELVRRHCRYILLSDVGAECVGLHCTAAKGVFKFDTRLCGNSNRGHEFRNLKLEEFERYRGLAPTQRANPADRWAAALGLSPSEYREMTAERQRLHVRAESRYWLEQNSQAAKRPAGVLGAEFTNEERWALVEYLKSL